MSFFKRKKEEPKIPPPTSGAYGSSSSYADDYGADEYASSAYGRSGGLQPGQPDGRGRSASPSGYGSQPYGGRNRYDTPDDPSEYSYTSTAVSSRSNVLQKGKPASRGAPVREDTDYDDSYNDPYKSKSAPVSRQDPVADAKKRDLLFAGATVKPAAGPAASRNYGEGEEEEEEDEEALVQKTRDTRKETRRVLQETLATGRQALDTAQHVNRRLAEQGEQLGGAQRHFIAADGHANRAGDNIEAINRYNRSIFIPAVVFDKSGKRKAEEEKQMARYEKERAAHDQNYAFSQSQRAARGKGRDGPQDDEEEESIGPRRGYGRSGQTLDPADQDEEDEAEISNDLNILEKMVGNLKFEVQGMGKQVEGQVSQIKRMEKTVATVDQNVATRQSQLRRIN